MEKYDIEIDNRTYNAMLVAMTIGLLLVGFAAGWIAYDCTMPPVTRYASDTVWRDSVVVVREPMPASDSVMGREQVSVICKGNHDWRQVTDIGIDTFCKGDAAQVAVKLDTATVDMDVVQRKYEDSLLTVWVSGLRYKQYPRLDSAYVHRRTEIITRTVMQYAKRKNWSLSVGVGVGWDGRDVRPGIQATVGYKILEF